ncbi:MAG: hypothetical protein LBK61_01725 [Spirochaetaceae bacterium]|nr:hypothetical protein [Spirochaetaceae bacterium]
MKKFFYGAIALLSVSLIFLGCPTDSGETEEPVKTETGTELSTPAVDAKALETAFAQYDVVTLLSAVTSVDGVVPAGKKLVVKGKPSVKSGEFLEVKGTLQIEAGAVLNSSYVSGASGYLKGAGTVTGAGSVKLPYFGTSATPPDGVISFTSVTVTAGKIAGSYINDDKPGGPLNVAGVKALFGLQGGPDELTVDDLTGIDGDTVPSGKKLTLNGDGNTTTALDLSGKGKLVVADGAVLEVTTSITGKADTDVQGTIKFKSAETALSITGIDLSKATIDATDAGDATLTLPTGAQTVKAITVGATYDLTIAGATELTVGSITAGTGKGVKSASVAKYVTGTDFVQLGAAAASFIVSSVKNSVFAVETGTGAAVVINSALDFGGNAKLKTNGTGGISVTGETGGYLELTTDNLAKFAPGSKITFSDAATGATGTLEIPADVEVVATGATLASITGLKVVGTLTVDTPDLTVLINGANITGSGELIAGALADAKGVLVVNSTLAKATLATTAFGSNLTIQASTTRVFTGAAAPTGDVTVEGTGNLTVSGSGSLTIAEGKTLSNAGTVALTDTASLVLTTASAVASAATDGAKITGAGTLTAQDLEITGEWQAILTSNDATEFVTIASTADAGKSTITGSTTTGKAELAGGASGRITQKAGTASNALTLTTVTIDVSTDGEVNLVGADSNGAELVLTAAAIIKGSGSGSALTTGDITHIGTVAVNAGANITIGTDLAFVGTSAAAFQTITGSGSNNNLVAKKDSMDISLTASTTVTTT